MPELPEVETIKNDLRGKIIGQEITGIEIKKAKMVKPNQLVFQKEVIGQTIKKIERRGKLLIVSLEKKFLLIHLKMTGQLIYVYQDKLIAGGHSLKNKEGNQPGKYSHIIFSLSNGAKLYFNDLRQFGYVKLVDKKERDNALKAFGVEPLSPDFTEKKWEELLNKQSGNIKAFLMNQKKIAGIGNIYADEICFSAKVKPQKKITDLKGTEKKRLFEEIKKILKKAILYRGTTFNDYRDGDGHKGNFKQFLQVYGREKKPCLRCKKGIIKKIRVASRGTRYCDHCQV